ncbi:MAG: fibronectin type III domain-containing protein [Dehalococcoidia bacterium]
MHIKRIQVTVIAGLLLGMLILPQLALADGPEIMNVVVLDHTSTTATIFWTTNTSSTSRVNYGTNSTLGKYVYDSNTVTTHFVPLTSLTPNTIYYFEVQSTDTTGPTTDNNTGAYYQFTTLQVTSYNITLNPVCGVCGDLVSDNEGLCRELIGVTALVAVAGTYHISWDSLTNVMETFTANTAGSYSLVIFTPQATKGDHKVYLVDNTYAQEAFAIFTVLPSVKIDPEKGPVGTNVTLNGYGFTALQQLQIKFNDKVIKTPAANATGSWNVSYSIPDTPAGGYTFDIEAKEGTVWVNWVSKYFKVTPQITVTPSSGRVGQTIRVNGTGFASKEKDIEVTFGGKTVKKISYAQDNGSWNDIIAVPPVQRGDYEIDASGTSTRARDVPPVTFTVNAGILLDPISAFVGDNITVKGGGFEPGETGIKVSFDGKLVTSTTITANISGCWGTSFVLDASTYGSHTVSASGDITQPPVTNTLTTLTKIVELSPIEGAPGDSVTLTGSGFNGNKKLTVTVDGIPAPGEDGQPLDVRTQTNGNVLATFRVPANTAGNKTVEVKDEGLATASAKFTVKKKVLTTPEPISPEKDNKLRSGEITFRWGGITSGSNITYILQISNSPDVATYVWRKADIETSTYTLSGNETLPKGTYYWWVKAVDNYDNESLWSNSSSFTVSPIPTWVWVVVGIVVLVGLMVVAYRETKFKVTE